MIRRARRILYEPLEQRPKRLDGVTQQFKFAIVSNDVSAVSLHHIQSQYCPNKTQFKVYAFARFCLETRRMMHNVHVVIAWDEKHSFQKRRTTPDKVSEYLPLFAPTSIGNVSRYYY